MPFLFFQLFPQASALDEGYLFCISFSHKTDEALIEGKNENVIKEASQTHTCSLRRYYVQGSVWGTGGKGINSIHRDPAYRLAGKDVIKELYSRLDNYNRDEYYKRV